MGLTLLFIIIIVLYLLLTIDWQWLKNWFRR